MRISQTSRGRQRWSPSAPTYDILRLCVENSPSFAVIGHTRTHTRVTDFFDRFQFRRVQSFTRPSQTFEQFLLRLLKFFFGYHPLLFECAQTFECVNCIFFLLGSVVLDSDVFANGLVRLLFVHSTLRHHCPSNRTERRCKRGSVPQSSVTTVFRCESTVRTPCCVRLDFTTALFTDQLRIICDKEVFFSEVCSLLLV